MKRLMSLLLILSFVSTIVSGALTNTIKIPPTATWWKQREWYRDDAQRWAREVEDILEGVTSIDNKLIIEEISAPAGDPAANTIWIYSKDDGGGTSAFFVEDDAGSVVQISAGSGDNTLDNAYDQGGAGAGRTITADTGAVVITNTDADAAFLLSLTPTPGSSAATGGASIVVGANSTEDALQITQNGSGFAISVASDGFTVDSDGDVNTPEMTATTGNITTINATTANISAALNMAAGITLDDGSGASPDFTLRDGSDETAVFSKADSGNLSLTTLAADGFQVLTGNLRVGNGSPGTAAMNGEDAYVEGELEVDGAAQFDGAVTAASTFVSSGAATFNNTTAFSENMTFTVAADERFQIDADTTPNTATNGVIDLNVQSATNNHKAISLTYQLEDSATQAYGFYVDVDDDTSGAEVFDAFSVLNSAGTNATTRGLVVANTIDDAIVATLGAGSQFAVVDAASTINTGTAGVWDVSAILSENAASVMNIDVESEADGAGEIVHGIFVQMDDDADNADNEIHGIHVRGDGTNGTGLQHAINVQGANIDAGLYLRTGYLRVGTGSSPDVTPGDDDVYVEGTLEVDGAVRFDGAITAAGTLTGYLKTVTDDTDNETLAATDSGGVFTNQADADNQVYTLPTAATGLIFTFTDVESGAGADLYIRANSGDTIAAGSANEYYACKTDAANQSVTVVAISDTEWIVVAEVGTWVNDDTPD